MRRSHGSEPASTDYRPSNRSGIGVGAIGLGDLIKMLTSKLGIRTCGECERRAARLNAVLPVPFGRRK